jgi:hypothetical protein
MPRIYQGRHRLNTLSLARQQQTGEIGFQRLTPISVVDNGSDLFDITYKSEFSIVSVRDHAIIVAQSVGRVHHYMTQ